MAERYDAVVIGSGIAGLSFALKAAARGTVALVTKRAASESNTVNAQGGIASVLAPGDSIEAHVADTVLCGDGLCHRDAVQVCVAEGPERVRELMRLGAEFDMSATGEFDLTREGGHTQRRVVHAGDITGREVIRVLLSAARANPNIHLFENHFAIDVIVTAKHLRGENKANDGGNNPDTAKAGNRALGAYVLDVESGSVRTLLAPVTVLATGGAGKVYLYTSNPDVATGDGIAMAYRAGAVVSNMEMFQFHPTCLFHPHAKSFLISEALRGEGGILRTVDGGEFMGRYHPMQSLAPRDIVARAIDAELKRRGDDYVWLDMTHLSSDFLKRRFPNIFETCARFGVDMTTQPIPVVPAAHYSCGGVVTDLTGETNIRGLYAIGEVAMTGLHGANRLASNSLLEGLVFAHRAAAASTEHGRDAGFTRLTPPDWDAGRATNSDEMVVVSQNWDEVRRLMWNYVGIVRSTRRLERARRRIAVLLEEIREYYWDFLVTRDLLELRNIATVADLVIQCALQRRESRGLHTTIDYPSKRDEARDTTVRR
ncbi:MAG: L-aspartate oxidase [Deltaproteobacteria bacterium]|nr:L-aspartate oxidase [Deltaproteobacteria bacterium]